MSVDNQVILRVKKAAHDGERSLDLSFLGLTTLPAEIGLLESLEELDLKSNHLSTLPPEIGRLRNLTDLGIERNNLQALPPEIGGLTNLRSLSLLGNSLETVPKEIGQLSSLQKLDLMLNHLTTLPIEIGELTELESLDLSHNNLIKLPPQLGRLRNLEFFDLNHNPLSGLPPEIVSQGTQAILAYLRDQLLGGVRQWVSKLLVVGEGGVGKTSLLCALRKEEFAARETTHGIEIKSLNLKHPWDSRVVMKLNSWDFGGQEIYHATHQFFLTNRSLFVLTWNARLGFEQGKLYYWLDTIKARAPESPVLIVATHVDERDANIPLADLRRKYSQIVGAYEISNKTLNGIDRLEIAIADAAEKLPLMGEMWPSNWLRAAESIRRASVETNYVSPSELWDFMSSNQVQDGQRVLAQWLHELGDILFFQDDEDLNDTVILSPHWVTESISRVLESEEVISNLGLFTRRHMDELWSDINWGMTDHFLRLMEKFDLSYRTLENRDISLVVERLNLDPPGYEQVWNQIKDKANCSEVSIKYEIDTTMPAGIPSWFIARSHRFTTRTHWRYGALLADGSDQKHLGLIQAFPHDRFLTLSVRGPTPQNFFALLMDGLELTLRRFPGLNIQRKVPCPGHNGRHCDHEFDLAHLQSAIERERPVFEIQCPVTFESMSIPSLLFGLHWSLTREVLIEQNNQIIAKIADTNSAIGDLRELAQREFTKLFRREQSDIESYCPNVFVLRPSDARSWLNIAGQKMDLQLFCQAPGQWHPTETGGLYQVREPAEWLQTMAPYIEKMVSLLKYATPLLGPWVGVLSSDHYKKMFDDDIKLMNELVKKLPEIGQQKSQTFDDPRLSVEFEGLLSQRVQGAALRALRRLLEEKDPEQQWGGLRRVLTPEGHFLWLCQHHSLEYT